MCHAYMYGLGGAENGKSLKSIGFKGIFEGVKGARVIPRVQRRSREIPLEGHFGSTLGSLCTYSDDFGSLYDYFVIVVELPWL